MRSIRGSKNRPVIEGRLPSISKEFRGRLELADRTCRLEDDLTARAAKLEDDLRQLVTYPSGGKGA